MGGMDSREEAQFLTNEHFTMHSDAMPREWGTVPGDVAPKSGDTLLTMTPGEHTPPVLRLVVRNGAGAVVLEEEVRLDGSAGRCHEVKDGRLHIRVPARVAPGPFSIDLVVDGSTDTPVIRPATGDAPHGR